MCYRKNKSILNERKTLNQSLFFITFVYTQLGYKMKRKLLMESSKHAITTQELRSMKYQNITIIFEGKLYTTKKKIKLSLKMSNIIIGLI